MVAGHPGPVAPPLAPAETRFHGTLKLALDMKCRRIIVNRRRQMEFVEEDLPKPGPGEVRL